jgi:capsular exopolysaccharide synthesis family protein
VNPIESRFFLPPSPGSLPPNGADYLRPGPPDLSLRDFWRILRRRQRAVVASMAVCFLLALLASLLMSPQYESVSLVEVNKENSDFLNLDTWPTGVSDSLDYSLTLETQANVLRSDSLAFQVAEQVGLEKRPEFSPARGWFDTGRALAERNLPLEKAPLRRRRISQALHSSLTVKTVPGTRMIEVRFRSRDPQLAADVVNTLVGDYLEQYFRTRYNATAQASEWLGKQLAELKSQVEQAQEKVVAYQKQAGILGTDEAHNVVMAKLEELNKQLTAAETNRMLKQTAYQIAKTGNAELIATVGSSNLLGAVAAPNNNPLALVQSLRAQQAALKVQYAQAATKYGPAYPKLIQMRNQLQELENAIQAEIGKVAARAENDYLAARNAEDMLRAAFERQKQEANKLNDSAVRYTIMKREAESSRDLYDGLLKKLKEAGVLAGLRSTNLVVVDPARSSARPVRPNYPINLGLGLGVGLVGGIGLAFAREGFDSTLRTPEQVEAVAGLPAVGVIPDLAAGHALRRLLSAPKPDCNILDSRSSQLAESFRALRTALLFSNGEVPPKVIVVTSALPQEGKTTASLNSAIALAYQGAKVLLIDADLRRPELHARLDLPAEPGLGELLAGEAQLPVQAAPCPKVPDLFILPAGRHHPRPAEVLGSRSMRHLLNNCRERFDFVVIDTPPVLAVTDAVVLSKSADSVLLVVRSAQTSEQSLLRARDLLLRVNARIAGVLVNRADLHSPDYYDSYGFLGDRFGKRYYGLNNNS